MKYTIISSMYDENKQKMIERTTNVDDEASISQVTETETDVVPEPLAIDIPLHRVECVEGVEYLVSRSGEKIAIWSLLEK
jgi:hypothetical protein